MKKKQPNTNIIKSLEVKGSSFYFTLPINNPLAKIDSSDKIEFVESI